MQSRKAWYDILSQTQLSFRAQVKNKTDNWIPATKECHSFPVNIEQTTDLSLD